ncbi:MAG: negative regulator of tic competence family protein [Bacillales bacterium]|nr:negative regulator of tic competence family protein [Bacillales bacterium]
MRLERLNPNKFKVFLTFDDLIDRGLTKDDLWHNAPKVQQLFQDMMKEASDELGFEMDGKLAVEIYSLQAQGMVVIVTKEKIINNLEEDYDDDDDDDFVEMQVTLDEVHEVLFEIYSLEDVIDMAYRVCDFGNIPAKLYMYDSLYYLYIDPINIETVDIDVLISILSEYGNPSVRTIHRIQEYGKVLFNEQAINNIIKYFKKS